MQAPAENLRIRLSSVGDAVIETYPPVRMDSGIAASDLMVSYKVAVEVDRPRSQVGVKVTMAYTDARKTLFSGTLETTFYVVDLASYITEMKREDEFRIESDFLPMMISLAFSTTRGYFVRELQGTALEPYPFPIVSMESIQKRTTYKLK